MDWIGLEWSALDWIDLALASIGLGWVWLDWIGLDCRYSPRHRRSITSRHLVALEQPSNSAPTLAISIIVVQPHWPASHGGGVAIGVDL